MHKQITLWSMWSVGMVATLTTLGWIGRIYVAGDLPSNTFALWSMPALQPVSVAVEPKREQTVAAVIMALPDASQFRSLLAEGDLTSKISGKGPYTVFVPVDAAFDSLPPNAFGSMTLAEKRRLASYHVVAGKTLAPTLSTTTAIKMLSKDTLSVSADPKLKTITVGDGWALQVIPAKNGIVYLVSSVLVPPSH